MTSRSLEFDFVGFDMGKKGHINKRLHNHLYGGRVGEGTTDEEEAGMRSKLFNRSRSRSTGGEKPPSSDTRNAGRRSKHSEEKRITPDPGVIPPRAEVKLSPSRKRCKRKKWAATKKASSSSGTELEAPVVR